jgi:hypothetical protein
MIGIVEIVVMLGATASLLVMLVVILRIRSRRAERLRRWQQLGSVYDHQERRSRGD